MVPRASLQDPSPALRHQFLEPESTGDYNMNRKDNCPALPVCLAPLPLRYLPAVGKVSRRACGCPDTNWLKVAGGLGAAPK